jgi:hypothetical protein
MLASVAPETAPPAAPVVGVVSVVVLVLESVDDSDVELSAAGFVVELSAAGSVVVPSVGTTVLVVSVFLSPVVVCSFALSSDAPLVAGTVDAASGFTGAPGSEVAGLSVVVVESPVLSSPVVVAAASPPVVVGSVVFEPLSSAAGLVVLSSDFGLSAGLSDFVSLVSTGLLSASVSSLLIMS